MISRLPFCVPDVFSITDDNGVPVTADSMMRKRSDATAAVSHKPQHGAWIGQILLGPSGNRRAALISLRSDPTFPSRATDRIDSTIRYQ